MAAKGHRARFQDRREHLYDFLDEVLVRCPRCTACAVVVPRPSTPPDRTKPPGAPHPDRRLRCDTCALVRDTTATTLTFGTPHDPYFHHPLWLQADVRGHILWAYNAQHLTLLETYVSAHLRERGTAAPAAPTSLLERLPTWIKSAKNRTKILQTIHHLHATLPPPDTPAGPQP
ncbi:hypothetical protein LO762_11145 [Actinocorallia sp. API 0066]|uniref:hypothetical protein n=1 Tax=Actinocorallia sp. API 0066 TaxID=2896846 RepID=UPI001E585092|nr:hypothetical protein [Actinocorallia sp. API 0066]MCD0449741.1 hypothetical protein [Actinocorallia sp. API 0066]